MLYVIEALDEVPTTKLQKVLYLSDLEHFLETGTTLTGARWVRYTHGPMAKALLPSVTVMDGHEIQVRYESRGAYEARVFRPGPSPRFRPALAIEERTALDTVINVTRPLTVDQTIVLAYNTAPMRAILRLERGVGVMLDTEIPFDLDDDLVRDAASPVEGFGVESTPDTDPARMWLRASETRAHYGQRPPDERAEFKRAELGRMADLAEAASHRAP